MNLNSQVVRNGNACKEEPYAGIKKYKCNCIRAYKIKWINFDIDRARETKTISDGTAIITPS